MAVNVEPSADLVVIDCAPDISKQPEDIIGARHVGSLLGDRSHRASRATST
jgi:hypothetical protein